MSASVTERPASVLARAVSPGATTPERLRRVEAVLIAGCLLLGVLGVVGGMVRSSAVHEGRTRIAALTTAAADIYQALADADAAATSGYVSGGLEPAAVRARYDADIQRASDRITAAAGLLTPGDPTITAITAVGEQLPVYTGLVERARALNRLGLPLGQSYLASASTMMQQTILPAVQQVRGNQSTVLEDAYRTGHGVPIALLAVGIALLAAGVDLALRERRRTNRVLNVGLVVAGCAVLAIVGWWAIAAVAADNRLAAAEGHGDAGMTLDDARIAVLQARSNEGLVLVARNSGGGSSDQGYTAQMVRVVGDGGLFAAAAHADPELDGRIDALNRAAAAWQLAHRGVRVLDDGGQYARAVTSVVGTAPGTSGGTFAGLDATLAQTIADERAAFAVDIAAADAVLQPLALASAILALLAVAGVVVGIGQRVGEYR